MISLQIGAVGGCENAGASPCSCLWVTRVGLGLELGLGLGLELRLELGLELELRLGLGLSHPGPSCRDRDPEGTRSTLHALCAPWRDSLRLEVQGVEKGNKEKK